MAIKNPIFKKQLLIASAVFSLFALFMTIGIYWRASDIPVPSRLVAASFSSVFFGQICIWIFWVALLVGLKRTIEVSLSLKARSEISNSKFVVYLALSCLVVLTLHYGWMVLTSDLLSPYHKFPDSRFGVFRYFFIFWVLIDLVIVVACLIVFLFQLHAQNLINNLTIKSDAGIISPSNDESEEKALDVNQKTNTRLSNENIIKVRVGTKQIMVAVNQIGWIEANDYYANLHTPEGGYLVRQTLRGLEKQLPICFIRVHRSTIVNINFVESIKNVNGKHLVILKDGTSRSISKTGYHELCRVTEHLK